RLVILTARRTHRCRRRPGEVLAGTRRLGRGLTRSTVRARSEGAVTETLVSRIGTRVARQRPRVKLRRGIQQVSDACVHTTAPDVLEPGSLLRAPGQAAVTRGGDVHVARA